MKKINPVHYAAAGLVVTILCGLIYAAVQQAHRSGANDPQIAIARDIKYALEHNRSLSSLATHDSLDLATSLSVFTTLFDKNGMALQSTGFLGGQFPKMPPGVLDFARAHSEDQVTWQPQPGVRMAMVVEAVRSPQASFVAVGRSLKEVEKRESNLTTMVLVAWLVCGGIILLHALFTVLTTQGQKTAI